MANTGFISMAPAIAAVAAQVTVVDGIVDDIIVDTADIRTDVTVIRDTDLPLVKTDTGNIRGTDIGTITDAIDAKIIRGTFTQDKYVEAPGDTNWHDAISVTGEGKLVWLNASSTTSGGSIRLTVDGLISNVLILVADELASVFVSDHETIFKIDKNGPVGTMHMNIEFRASLLIEVKQDDGANVIRANSFYQLDS
ncbi:unnamed protein product [marine sediment metagenome]|uniref:Uncharacterized protein n=1 Tax=marine sediment metagenome TaxID=412755 RepID=X1LF61_9ZZZZ